MDKGGQVISIRDWTMLDELGNPVAAKRVSFSYPDGTPSHVDIPTRTFSKENVDGAIDAAVETWREIMGR